MLISLLYQSLLHRSLFLAHTPPPSINIASSSHIISRWGKQREGPQCRIVLAQEESEKEKETERPFTTEAALRVSFLHCPLWQEGGRGDGRRVGCHEADLLHREGTVAAVVGVDSGLGEEVPRRSSTGPLISVAEQEVSRERERAG
jgi:hypothetical protein